MTRQPATSSSRPSKPTACAASMRCRAKATSTCSTACTTPRSTRWSPATRAAPGFMALAEGRLGETPGIAMVTRGPGAANAMIAIHTAWQDATADGALRRPDPAGRPRTRRPSRSSALRAGSPPPPRPCLCSMTNTRPATWWHGPCAWRPPDAPDPVVVGLPEDVLVRTDRPPPFPPVLPLPDCRAERRKPRLAVRHAARRPRPASSSAATAGTRPPRPRLPNLPRPPMYRCWPTGAPTTPSTTIPRPTRAGWATAGPNAP